MSSRKDVEDSFDDRADSFRQEYLAVSGGWLGTISIYASDIFGIWDFLVLAVIAILDWIVIRTTTMEIALVLGFAFDGVIPLQYYRECEARDKALGELHKTHLDHYWPVFFIGSAIEAAGYVLLHPDLFTLLVALKTVVCTWIWMGRKENGVFLSSAVTRGKNALASGPSVGRASTVPSGGSRNPSGGASGGQVAARSEIDGGWWAEMDERLEKWGYVERLGRAGMIDAYESQDKDTRQRYLREWDTRDASKRAEFSDKYGKRLDEKRKKELRSFPVDSRLPDAEAQLRHFFPDALARWGLLHALKKTKPDQAKRNLEKWTSEEGEVRRRTARYQKQAEQAGALKSKSIGSGTGARGNANADAYSGKTYKDLGLPKIEDSRHPDAERGIAEQYSDPATVWGMLDVLRASEDKYAAIQSKAWSSANQSDEDKRRRAGQYAPRAHEVLDILHPKGKAEGAALNDAALTRLESHPRVAQMPDWDRTLIRKVLSGPRTYSQERGIIKRLARFRVPFVVPRGQSATKPIVRPAGGRSPSGLPNEWLNHADKALWDDDRPERLDWLDMLEDGTGDFQTMRPWRQWYTTNHKYRFDPPRAVGGYDSDGGTLGYFVDDLKTYRKKLEEFYPPEEVDVMLADFKRQETRAEAQAMMDRFTEATRSEKELHKIMAEYGGRRIELSRY